MSVISLIKPKRDQINMAKPRIQDMVTSHESKLTFETLLKFIEQNKQLIINPQQENNAISKNDNIAEDDDNEEVIEEINVQKKPTMLNLGDSTSISFIPENLKLILNAHLKQMFRFGIKVEKEYNFIQSYIISIMMCLKSSFSFLSKSTYEEFNNYVSIIIRMVLQHIRSNDLDFKNYNDKNYEKAVYSHTVFSKFMRHVADLLHVNIFVIDMSHDTLLFVNKYFNKYRMNIFLFQLTEQYYEPVFFNEKKFISHNHPLIIELIDNPKNITTLIDCKFEYSEENIDGYIKEEKLTISLKDKILERSLGYKNKENNIHQKSETKPVLVSHNEKQETKNILQSKQEQSQQLQNNETLNKNIAMYDKKKLEKKSATEIRDLAESLGIDTNNKTNNGRHKTKVQLIDEIISVNKK